MVLARLSIPLQKIVDHLDRVLAGCCWEAHATRAVPEEFFPFMRLASKTSYHAAGRLFGERTGCHPQGDFDPPHQEAL